MPLKYYLKNQIANPILDGQSGKNLEWEALSGGMGVGAFDDSSTAAACLDALIARRTGGVRPISQAEYDEKKKVMPYVPSGPRQDMLQALPSPGNPFNKERRERVVVEVGNGEVTILKSNGDKQKFVPADSAAAAPAAPTELLAPPLTQATPPVTGFKPRQGRTSRPAPIQPNEPPPQSQPSA